MNHLNESAQSFSLNELRKFTEIETGLDSEWLEAITKWADDPDMVLVLTGRPLEGALAKVTNRFSPRMACARMMADYFRHLSGCKQNYIPKAYKMKCEIVDNKLWVWHR